MRKLWPKYENWSEQENQNRVYRYTSYVYRYTLAKNDQNTKCTGTCSKCTGTCSKCTGTCSKCTGTHHQKLPRMCVFHPFFHILIPNQLYTSNTHQDHSKIILESIFNSIPLSISYLSSKIHLGFLPKLF